MIWRGAAQAGAQWDWTPIAGVAVGALALVGVYFAIRTYFRDHPRPTLQWAHTWEKTSIVEEQPGYFIARTEDGTVWGPVSPNVDIWRLDLRVRLQGRTDLTSNCFDGDKPIVFEVDDLVVMSFQLEYHTGRIRLEEAQVADGTRQRVGDLIVQPQLIRPGSESKAWGYRAGGSTDVHAWDTLSNGARLVHIKPWW